MNTILDCKEETGPSGATEPVRQQAKGVIDFLATVTGRRHTPSVSEKHYMVNST